MCMFVVLLGMSRLKMAAWAKNTTNGEYWFSSFTLRDATFSSFCLRDMYFVHRHVYFIHAVQY